MENKTARREVQSVHRAFAVLECVLTHSKGISLAEVSREVDLNKNTVFQLLTTLCTCGYLMQDERNRCYYPGIKLLWVHNLNGLYANILSVAKPILEQLTNQCGETSHLAIMEGVYARFLDKVESPQPLAVTTDLNLPIPLQLTAVGKAMLSRLTEDHLKRLESEMDFRRCTTNSICSVETLRQELTVTARRGYAVDDEENFHGVRCIAAPIMEKNGNVICSIGISAPKERLIRMDTTAAYVLQAAEKLQKKLASI